MKQIKGWWLPESDTHFENYIDDRGYQTIHRDTILEYIKQHKPVIANCIDVGSHVGFWSKDLTEYFKHVYAFEPIPDVRECYIKNIVKDNYTLYPYGVGGEEKTIKVLYDPEETGNTHASEKGNLQIEIKRLDSFDFLPIDYIKIDAEGYEIEVVKGAQKIIERDKPFIHVEAKKKVMIKQNISMNDIENYFNSINYKQVLTVKSEILYAPK
jgi:FkbM family methyltransferase